MSIEEIIHEKGDDIRRIAARHGAFNVRVFGSVARGEAEPESDKDLPGRCRITHQFLVPGRSYT